MEALFLAQPGHGASMSIVLDTLNRQSPLPARPLNLNSEIETADIEAPEAESGWTISISRSAVETSSHLRNPRF